MSYGYEDEEENETTRAFKVDDKFTGVDTGYQRQYQLPVIEDENESLIAASDQDDY